MTVMGTIKNGVIVPDESPTGIPEGTRVRIVLESEPNYGFTLEDLKDLDRPLFKEGYPGELNDLLKMVQDERENDLKMQIEREGTGPD